MMVLIHPRLKRCRGSWYTSQMEVMKKIMKKSITMSKKLMSY